MGNFSKILIGQCLTQIFDRALSLGLLWGFSGDDLATKASLFVGLGALPHLLFSKSSSHVISRYGHRKVILYSEIIRSFLIAVTLITAILGDEFFKGWGPYLLTIFLNCAAAYYNPAILSSPRFFLTDAQVERATSLINFGFSLSNVVGPLAFGILFQMGLSWLLGFAALSYLASSCLVWVLRDGKRESHTLDGLDASTLLPQLVKQLLVTFAVMNLALGPLQVFIPLYAKASGDLADYARYEFALALGLLTGGFLPFVFNHSERVSDYFLAGLFGLLALSYFVFAVAPNTLWLLTSLAGLGLSLGWANVLLLTRFQRVLELSALPKLMAAINVISTATLPVSMALSGLLMMQISFKPFAVSCAVMLMVAVLGFQLLLFGRSRFQSQRIVP